jgi:aldehyde dehydrogenase family protein
MVTSEAVRQRVRIPPAAENLSEECIAYLEGLVSQARNAAAAFTQYTQEDVDRIVKPMVVAGLEQAQYLARLAVEETRLGVMEDKALKNMVATEFVYNYVKDKRTVGAIREFPERGLVEVAEPIGVIFSLTPITNPTSTVLFKCIMAIKTRNAVIFSPHPNAWRCCYEAVKIMYETALKHGAPEGVFTCLKSHGLAENAYLMRHKDVGLIDATGGPGVVKAAYSSGKPALGVGPGNTPVYLEKTADRTGGSSPQTNRRRRGLRRNFLPHKGRHIPGGGRRAGQSNLSGSLLPRGGPGANDLPGLWRLHDGLPFRREKYVGFGLPVSGGETRSAGLS